MGGGSRLKRTFDKIKGHGGNQFIAKNIKTVSIFNQLKIFVVDNVLSYK